MPWPRRDKYNRKLWKYHVEVEEEDSDEDIEEEREKEEHEMDVTVLVLIIKVDKQHIFKSQHSAFIGTLTFWTRSYL